MSDRTPEELAENIASILNASTFDASDPKAFEKKLARLLANAIRETKAQRDELFNAALGAEQIIADFIGVYGDSGAGEVLAELRAAIRRAQGGGDE